MSCISLFLEITSSNITPQNQGIKNAKQAAEINKKLENENDKKIIFEFNQNFFSFFKFF